MKKISKIFIALFMVLTLAMPASVNAASASITIKNNPADTGLTIAGKTFSIYKLFDLEVKELGDDEAEDKVSYTVSTKFENFFKANVDASFTVGSTEFNDAAITLVNSYDGTKDKTMYDFVRLVRAYVESSEPPIGTDKTATVPTGSTEESITVNGLDNGYYLVMDNAGDDGVVAASALLNSYDGAENVTVTLKGSKPTIDKQIKDNDPDANPEYGHIADHQIGDKVEFKVIAKLPTNTEGYEFYKYMITDVMSDGLVYNSDLLVSLDGNNVTTYVKENLLEENDKGFTITIANLLKDSTFKDGKVIELTYSATLTKDAVIAGVGDNNKVTLDYSNNPYDTESFGKAEDDVYNFTFEGDFTKTAGDGLTPLANAEFTLFIKDGTNYEKVNLCVKGDGVTYYPHYKGETITSYPPESKFDDGTIVTTDAGKGKFNIIGLDDNVTYVLRETKAPEGFNAAADIEFIIKVTYENGLPIVNVTSEQLGDTENNTVVGTIINTSAVLLPSTGGVGTVMFSVVGVSIMVGAALLIIKGKKEENI